MIFNCVQAGPGTILIVSVFLKLCRYHLFFFLLQSLMAKFHNWNIITMPCIWKKNICLFIYLWVIFSGLSWKWTFMPLISFIGTSMQNCTSKGLDAATIFLRVLILEGPYWIFNFSFPHLSPSQLWVFLILNFAFLASF